MRDETDLLGEEWRRGTARGVAVANEYSQRPASRSLDAAIDRVHRHWTEHREAQQQQGKVIAPDVPRKQRRWWKGLGQITEGAALAIADVGIAVGAFKLPVSPETQTYGAVVSAAAGMGKIMNGVGDLWGE